MVHIAFPLKIIYTFCIYEEVEEAFSNCKKITRKPRSPDRYYLFGQTDGGRYLFIVFQYKGFGIIRPISARDMNPHERAFYERP